MDRKNEKLLQFLLRKESGDFIKSFENAPEEMFLAILREACNKPSMFLDSARVVSKPPLNGIGLDLIFIPIEDAAPEDMAAFLESVRA